jgi:hypothetical protein
MAGWGPVSFQSEMPVVLEPWDQAILHRRRFFDDPYQEIASHLAGSDATCVFNFETSLQATDRDRKGCHSRGFRDEFPSFFFCNKLFGIYGSVGTPACQPHSSKLNLIGKLVLL